MLTIFTTPKPFRGHINVIQRNALKSWSLLHPDVEVILFGDDEGAAEAARDFGIHHEPYVHRDETGMKRLDYMFGKAQAIARHDVVCYVNCDIILTVDFRRAVERVRAKYRRFLMVGHRWDTPITRPVDYSDPCWAEKVRSLALSTNDQRNEWFIDYFAFSSGAYGGDFPPFVIGTVRWDNWLIWKALNSRIPVIDASAVVVAIHQNHDYSYHPQGKQGVWEGDEARRNHELAGGWRYLRNLSHATFELSSDGRIRSTWLRKRRREIDEIRKNPRGLPSRIWYSLLDLTYDSRHAIGLNRRR
jgi:hypothetical protein